MFAPVHPILEELKAMAEEYVPLAVFRCRQCGCERAIGDAVAFRYRPGNVTIRCKACASTQEANMASKSSNEKIFVPAASEADALTHEEVPKVGEECFAGSGCYVSSINVEPSQTAGYFYVTVTCQNKLPQEVGE